MPETPTTETHFVCADCGRRIEGDPENVNQSGKDICEICSSNYRLCHECDSIFNHDNLERHNGMWYCAECWSNSQVECRQCGDSINREETYNTIGGDSICSACAGEHYTECYRCHYMIPNDEANERDGEWLCHSCERQLEREVIHDYGYKPSPKYRTTEADRKTYAGNKDGLLYFGVEEEVETGGSNDFAATLAKNPDVYLKTDGSIENGFEIVTHPCGLDYHHATLQPAIRATIPAHGARAHNTTTCGLHVHFSRNYLGEDGSMRQDLTIAKMLLFMERHWPEIVIFSRRKAFGYCERNGKTKFKSVKAKAYDRHSALNIQPRHTLEVRVFKGSTNPDTILASIEFVAGLVEYCKAKTVMQVNGERWGQFKTFMGTCKNISHTSEFFTYCEKKGI